MAVRISGAVDLRRSTEEVVAARWGSTDFCFQGCAACSVHGLDRSYRALSESWYRGSAYHSASVLAVRPVGHDRGGQSPSSESIGRHLGCKGAPPVCQPDLVATACVF